ncbi:MAG: Na(+)/H(+) antiporter subunit F1 [Peptococcaceae bacterium]|jgi:multicomponent Na+:H+ antiporter subunit F|nr:Na(+)/H(+) antiporter subunit F1 [Peptococcaceae bacterium]
MLKVVLLIALSIFSVSVLLLLIRVIKGPTAPDRIIAMDTIGINLLSIMALLSILLKTRAFMGAVLLFGMLSFIGTVAYSRFIERGIVIDYDDNR